MKSFEDALVHKTVSELFDMVKSKQAEVDELQKRVDEALRFYNDAKLPNNIGMMQMAIYLKGDQS